MEAAMSFLLESISQKLSYRLERLSSWKAKNEVEHLQDEVGLLKEFLKDLSLRSAREGEMSLREREGQIRQVIYEAGETIDKYIIEIAAEKAKSCTYFRAFLGSRDDLEDTLMSCRNRVRELVSQLHQRNTEQQVNSASIEIADIRLSERFPSSSDEARNELEHLQEEVGLLKEILKDVRFKELEGEIWQAIYEAEETIETYITETANPIGWSCFDRPVISCKNDRVRHLISAIRDGKIVEVNPANTKIAYMTAAVTRNMARGEHVGRRLLKEVELVHGLLQELLADVAYKEWEGQITNAVYEAEDIIKSFKALILAEKPFHLPLVKLIKSIHHMKLIIISFEKHCVKPLLALLPESKILKDSTKFDIADIHHMRAALTRDIRGKTRLPKSIVGFKDQADELIRYLSQETDKLEAISITGKPGSGKTTLAWKISYDPRIAEKFPTLIWVSVSSEFNVEHVLLTILNRVTTHQQRESIKMGVENLIVIVRNYLLAEKFLLVIDDIWTAEALREIKSFIPVSNKFGRVILTTRHMNVACLANNRRQAHELRSLSLDESWELLKYEAFGEFEVAREELVTVGKAIVELCDRNPLGIKVIGGILKYKVSKTSGSATSISEEWEDLRKSVGTYLLHEDKSKHLDKILWLSYSELPIELRKCFLYLGMFPQGFDIPAKKLTLLWIAEGFVQKMPKKSVEEISQEYLKDLISRNLVMVEKVKPNGDVKVCRLHGTVREFCRMTVIFENLNFFQEITKTRGVLEPSPDIIRSYHRLCIHSNVSEFFLEKTTPLKARSFLCFPKTPISLQSKDISHVIDGLSLLRVLAAKNIIFQNFPQKIAYLIHLRFLLLANKSETLPKVITNLRNLETLIVENSLRVLVIKADIWKMMNLRHLMSKASIVLRRDRKGNGSESLQTLGRLSPRSCTVEFANKAKHLIELGIQGKLSSLWDSGCLEKLDNLEKLKLVHDGSPDLILPVPGAKKFPPKIKVLVLKGTFLPWEQISSLAILVSLEELTLKENAFSGNTWEATRGDFKHLKILHIEQADVTTWTASDDSFPQLRSLSLINCPNLQKVPFNLKKNLQTLYIKGVAQSAVLSTKNIERAKDKDIAAGQAFKLEIAPADKTKTRTRDTQLSDPSSSTSS